MIFVFVKAEHTVHYYMNKVYIRSTFPFLKEGLLRTLPNGLHEKMVVLHSIFLLIYIRMVPRIGKNKTLIGLLVFTFIDIFISRILSFHQYKNRKSIHQNVKTRERNIQDNSS